MRPPDDSVEGAHDEPADRGPDGVAQPLGDTADAYHAAAPAAPASPAPPPVAGDPAAHDGGPQRTTLWRRTRRSVPSPRPRRGPIANLLLEPRGVLGIADFHELRREGLFDDCGRNPPPSWWAR